MNRGIVFSWADDEFIIWTCHSKGVTGIFVEFAYFKGLLGLEVSNKNMQFCFGNVKII